MKNKTLIFAKFLKTNEKLQNSNNFWKKNLNVMILYNQDMICLTFPAII